MNPIRVLLAVASVVALGVGIWLYQQQQQTPAIVHATVYPTPLEIPDYELVDAAGNPADRDFFRGDWDLVFFGFTHCPDICPATLQILSTARRQISESGITPLPRIVLVSVDPERDTPETLAQYIGYFGDGVAGLTGDLQEMRRLTLDMGVFFQKVEIDGGDYTVDHSSVVLLVDPEARVRALYAAPQTVEQVVEDYPGVLLL